MTKEHADWEQIAGIMLAENTNEQADPEILAHVNSCPECKAILFSMRMVMKKHIQIRLREWSCHNKEG